MQASQDKALETARKEQGDRTLEGSIDTLMIPACLRDDIKRTPSNRGTSRTKGIGLDLLVPWS